MKTSVAVCQYCRRKFFKLNCMGCIFSFFLSGTLGYCNNVTPNAASFFQKKAEGWHWYESQESEDRERRSEKNERKQIILDSTQQIERQRKNIETKLHTAIVEPTRENLIAYITAQKTLMDQSQRFAEMWKQVVVTTPSLDETLIHPVDQNARHIYYAAQHDEIKQRFMRLSQGFGLFFFFKNNCAYCHQFAPIVKRFAQKYDWAILAVSMDGGSLPEFPNFRRNNGMAERLKISHLPALVALHPKSGQLIPLAYGLISESEIENRVEVLTKLVENSIGENK